MLRRPLILAARRPRRAAAVAPGPARRAPAPASALALALLASGLAGCGSSTVEPTTPPGPPPLTSTLTGLEAGAVRWTTNLPTRGAVRWGLVSGAYDHLAYPAAAGEDRAFVVAHRVPLLEAPAGATVYIRRLDRSQAGWLYVADEETLQLRERQAAAAPRLELTCLDVQFGDANVVRLPTRGDLVAIDAGNWSVSLAGEAAPVHARRWYEDRAVDSIAVALATHIHSDHYGGFQSRNGQPGLLERFPIGLFLDVPAVTGNAGAWQSLKSAVDAAGIPRLVITDGMTSATAPDRLAWDPLVAVAVLNAGAQPEWAGMNLNNDSIVLRLSYGEVDLLTGGDAEEPAENRMLARYPQLLDDVEWFKAFHHGREAENTFAWVQAVAPRVVTITIAFSAYDEGYQGGLAATDGTLLRLGGIGADVFRFDAAEPLGQSPRDGVFWHTTFVTDGASYEVRIEPSVWGMPGAPASAPAAFPAAATAAPALARGDQR